MQKWVESVFAVDDHLFQMLESIKHRIRSTGEDYDQISLNSFEPYLHKKEFELAVLNLQARTKDSKTVELCDLALQSDGFR
jgi:TfoX/Sxy family transcriptional regulator of competence genes